MAPSLRLRGKRLGLLSGVCVVIALVAGAIIAWKLPYRGQGREDLPVAGLLASGAPPPPGPWQKSYVDNGWEPRGAFWKTGVEDEGTLSWQRKDRWEADESVHRYSSASLAAWYFDHRDPRQRLMGSSGRPEGFDDVITEPLGEGLGADGARYYCGKSAGSRGGCEQRWVWLRFGQYIVQIQVSEDLSAEQGPPSWLRAMTRDASGALTGRASLVVGAGR